MKRHKPKIYLQPGCAWVEDDDGCWETACGGHFIVNDGTPHENEMAYCPYCGLPLAQYKYEEEL